LRRALSDALEIGDRSVTALLDDAERGEGTAAERLYALAIEKCRGNVALAASSPEPFIEWSEALRRWACSKTNKECLSKLDAAQDKAREAVRLDANSPGALLSWGDALYVRGTRIPEAQAAVAAWSEASEKYQSALEVRPRWSKALIGLGRVLVERALRLPHSRGAHLFVQAITLFEQALREEPDSIQARLELANTHRLQAKGTRLEDSRRLWNAAAALCKTALESGPGAADVYCIQGWLAIDRAWWTTDDEATTLYRTAEERFRLMLALQPGSVLALTGLGEALAGRARVSREAHSEHFSSLAIEQLTRAVAIRGDFVPARTALGMAFLNMAQRRPMVDAAPLYESAWRKFRVALEECPEAIWAHYGLGNLARVSARQATDDRARTLLSDALTHYDAALRANADFYQALTGKGKALTSCAVQSSGPEADAFWQRARASLDAALAIKPDCHEALVALAQVHRLTAGGLARDDARIRIKEARIATARALATKPDYLWAVAEQVQALIEMSWLVRRGEALEYLKDAISLLQQVHWSAEPWIAFCARGDALMAWTLIMDAEPDQNRLGAALDQYERALKRRPDWLGAVVGAGRALSHLANCCQGAERLELSRQAIARFEAALELKADAIGALEGLANALRDRAHYVDDADATRLVGQALDRYASAIATAPRAHTVLTNWGTTLLEQAERHMGDEAGQLRHQAREKFDQALEVKSDHYPALYGIGLLLATQAVRGDGKADDLWREAIEKYRQTLAIWPEHHFALQAWGSALEELAERRTGQSDHEPLLKSAAELYRSAQGMNRNSADVALGLGRVLSRLAELQPAWPASELRAEAWNCFEIALTLRPDSREAVEGVSEFLSREIRWAISQTGKEGYEDVVPRLQALAEGPHGAIAYRAWGDALWRLAHNEPVAIETLTLHLAEAAQKYERALELMPEDVDGRFLWSQVQFERAQLMEPEGAKAIWLAIASQNEKHLARAPADPGAAYHWGWAVSLLDLHASDNERKGELLTRAADTFKGAVFDFVAAWASVGRLNAMVVMAAQQKEDGEATDYRALARRWYAEVLSRFEAAVTDISSARVELDRVAAELLELG
jgi:tetratricopeptide (TPR) repeat protein